MDSPEQVPITGGSHKEALRQLTEGDYKGRLNAVREITDIFWFERLAYVLIIVVSLLILLTAAVIALWKGKFETMLTIVSGGSGGVCAVATTGLLYMWNKSLNLVLKISSG